MSTFYKCDVPGCDSMADDPGVSFNDEEHYLPDNWRSGPAGDICPKHALRLADGSYATFDLGGTWGEDLFQIVGLDKSGARYLIEAISDTDGSAHRLRRTRESVESTLSHPEHCSWVPVGDA